MATQEVTVSQTVTETWNHDGERGSVDAMQIVLSKESKVPLREQLADQIVFLIRTGQLPVGEELPSVRALGRQAKVHHNTVSEAYQDLVRHGWLTRRRGSRLVVGTGSGAPSVSPHDLDELINESIQRARDMGYTLQALRVRVRERLLAQPPDHVLVVEQEPGMRDIIRAEVRESTGWSAQGCSYDEFAAEPGLAIGAQVLIANHLMEKVKPFVSAERPAIAVVYSQAVEHLELIRKLRNSSVICVASVSQLLLKTARSLLAPAIGRKHALHEILVVPGVPIDPSAADLVVCDTITLKMVRSRRKVHYRLIAADCLDHVRTSLTLA
jgi:DNA-binding transcriptional regulator YhcF (GntR family)